MERKILSSFILSLSLAFFLLTGLPVQAQNSNRPPASNPPKKEEKKEEQEEQETEQKAKGLKREKGSLGDCAQIQVKNHRMN